MIDWVCKKGGARDGALHVCFFDRAFGLRAPTHRTLTHAPPISLYTTRQAEMALRGHEWIGGAAGFDNRHQAPQNSSLLLVGIISGSKNFDVRSWLRRAFWQQRPWRLGVEWRFVVGTRLPRGSDAQLDALREQADEDFEWPPSAFPKPPPPERRNRPL